EREREARAGARTGRKGEHAIHGRPGLRRLDPRRVHHEVDGSLAKSPAQIAERGQGADEIAERAPAHDEDARGSFAHEPTATRRTSSRAQRSASSILPSESASPAGLASTTRSSVSASSPRPSFSSWKRRTASSSAALGTARA